MTNEIQHWLTTHFPRTGIVADMNLYLKPRHRTSDREPWSGDRIMIYEIFSGPGPAGRTVRGGCGGIIASADVAGGWIVHKTWHPEFTLEAICKNQDYDGFVPLADLRQFSLGFGTIGFGGGSGLLKVSAETFAILHRMFKSNPRCC